MNSKIDIRLVCLCFFAIAVASRLLPHNYNLTAVGALGLFVGCFWSARMGFLMAVSAMALSDVIGQWGNIASMGTYATALMFTVYVPMGLAAVVGKLLGASKGNQLKYWIGVPAGAIGAAVVFFLVSNFGCWLDPMMGYSKDLSGLMQSYIAGLPFARNTMIGNLLFSGLFFGSYAYLGGVVRKPAVAPEKVSD